MASPGNVCDRIDAAMKILAAKGFSKDGQVQGSAKYKFIPVAQILDAVREAHAAAGVKVIFGRPEYDTEQGEKRWTEVRKTINQATGEKYDVKWYFANGHMAVRIVGATPDDCIETVVGFEASDNSDKLTNKIYTNAERALYRTLYAIDESDGSDPEALNFENVISRFENRGPVKREAPKTEADSKGAEVAAVEQIGQDKVGEKMAEHYGIDVAKAKQALIRYHNGHISGDPNPILSKYTADFGGTFMANWSTSAIIDCYMEMVNAGHIEDTASTEAGA